MFFGCFCKGTNHVVGFKTLGHQHRYVEGFHHIYHIRNGFFNIVGHFFPVCLVIGKVGMALGGRHGVEGHTQMGWFLVADDVVQRVGKTQDCRGIESF